MSLSMLSWTDILEAVVLALACIFGLTGNMIVLNLSLKIRSCARQIALIFCAITCADAVVCAVRLPVTIYLILSLYPSVTENGINVSDTTTPAVNSSLMNEGTNDDVRKSAGYVSSRNATEQQDKETRVDMACEIWAASGAILYTIVCLHLLVGSQRLCIIFSFPTYRKLFTHISTIFLLAVSGLMGVAVVYTPLRVLGMRNIQAGRGTCRVSTWVPDKLVWTQSVETALICTVPVTLTAIFYGLILRSVWKAREVRQESLAEYNRAIAVTLTRVVTLTLTYFPLSLVLILDAKSGLIPDTVHRYIGFLYCAQSVISPFVTLQDNDFRQKFIQSKNGHVAKSPRNGTEGNEAGPSMSPEIEIVAGAGGLDENVSNTKTRRERFPPPFERALSFFTSSDLRSIPYSNEYQ